MALDSHKMTVQELSANMAAMRAIDSVMFQRNEQGRDLEKQGRPDEAIILYNENADDLFEGVFPYERLRIIYTQKKDYGRAIRACEAYLLMLDTIRGAEEKSHGSPRENMLAHIEKLRKRQVGKSP